MNLTLQAKGRQIGELNQKGTLSTSISGICIETYMNIEFWWDKQWENEESGM
jgi:hypothetical protein